MKKLLLFAFAITLFAACNSGTKAEEATVGEAQDAAALVGGKYVIDTTSVITWKGSKFNGDAHAGTLALSEGTFAVDNGTITGGSFTIDMNSIAVTDDMPDEYKKKLVGHLSNGDFFETEKYPTATFTITSVEALNGDSTYTHNISGNLKMKNIENNVTFKANIVNENGVVKATSQDFSINRMLWKVEYGNSLISKVKDEAIKDDLELKITLVANAAKEEAVQ
jgi:polyisoprenoid-binding protein YceI